VPAPFCEQLDAVPAFPSVSRLRGVQVWRMPNPVSLEAVLRAEEAILHIGLEASRALQRASLIFAVGPETDALDRRC
jgi:hypothetical protein